MDVKSKLGDYRGERVPGIAFISPGRGNVRSNESYTKGERDTEYNHEGLFKSIIEGRVENNTAGQP